VSDSVDVKENWEELKLKEGRKSVLSGVPKSLPALVKASRIQEKAQGIGFDWKKKEDVWDKVKEELAELETEMKVNSDNKSADAIESEFGDLLFSIINAARLYGVEPDNALEKTNLKFIQRFNYIEQKANGLGKSLRDMDLDEMDVYWEEAKG